jgi:thymidine kinase
MFAGKTSYLINLLIANAKVGRSVMAFKPAKDNRYSDSFIQSHNEAKFESLPIQSPLEALQKIDSLEKSSFGIINPFYPEVIGFDEAQFFEPIHLVKTVEELLLRLHVVIVAGLAQNSFGEPFGAMGSLMAMADENIQLPALCAKCRINKATRTYRKNSSMDRVLVGGASDYEPRCYSCWRH